MGKTIRMYLENDNPDELRTLEISNRTIKATVFPRPLLREFLRRKEANRPGVYMLYGNLSPDNFPMLYIGEGDPVSERLKDHGLNKDFWTEAYVFTSKDDYLTKTQIKFLESVLIDSAKDANRLRLDNIQSSNEPTISEADRDEAKEFFESIQLLVQVLRLNFFERLSLAPIEPTSDEIIYGFTSKGAEAKMAIREGKYVLLSGSTVVKRHTKSYSPSVKKYRDALINDGALKSYNEEMYIVEKDIPFNSSSYAADIVCGGSIAGPLAWKYNGKTLKDMESADQ